MGGGPYFNFVNDIKNADKTKYMVLSREQTAGLSHTVMVDNSSIERVEQFKYLGTMLTNQNFIRKKLRAD